MITAIIIEDEAPLRELLQMLIHEVDENVELLASCDSIEDGFHKVMQLKPDLIFLDVMLPGGTGFDLLEQLAPGTCEVIFITAYDSFALEAFRHAAVGYVLKPVDKAELKIAINNARRRIKSPDDTDKTDFLKLLQHVQTDRNGNDKIALPTPDGFLFVKANDIIRCESDKVYTMIFLVDGSRILCSYNIGEFRRILPDQTFFQIHKSHIVSLQFVRSYNGRENTIELTDGVVLPVSRRNKGSFLNNFRLIARQGE